MEKVQFSTLDVLRILDIERERLRDWVNRGYITPSIQQADGVGTKNVFSLLDLYGIGVFKYFLSRGISREEASSLVNHFISLTHPLDIELVRRVKTFAFVRCGSRVPTILFNYEEDPEESIRWLKKDPEVLASGWDDISILNFGKIMKEVDKNI